VLAVVLGTFLIVSVVGVATTIHTILTQTVPTTPSLSPAVKAGPCGSALVNDGPVLIPFGGAVVASCNGTGSGEAFDWVGGATSATPVFSLPANATDLYVIPNGSSVLTSCGNVSGSTSLSTDVPVPGLSNGAYDYCVDATGGFPSFTVTWNEG